MDIFAYSRKELPGLFQTFFWHDLAENLSWKALELLIQSSDLVQDLLLFCDKQLNIHQKSSITIPIAQGTYPYLTRIWQTITLGEKIKKYIFI